MKNTLLAVFCIAVFNSCLSTKPKDFTYIYQQKYTGLDSIIRTNGCYIMQRECDSLFYSAIQFYSDGLFCIVTDSNPQRSINCFLEKDKSSSASQYISWGIYIIENDTIKTQTIRDEGISSATIFRDYKINPDKSISNINEYVNPENSRIGYMRNYPSFDENKCPLKANFYQLEYKKDSTDCPYLRRNWFFKR